MTIYARIRIPPKPGKNKIEYATVPFQDQPRGTTKGRNFPVPPQWREFERRLHGDRADALQYRPGVWLVNAGSGNEEYITTAGNVVRVLETQAGHVLVKCYARGATPSAGEVNYLTYPDAVHKITATNDRGTVLVNPNSGVDMYHVIVENGVGGPWLDLSQVELFPSLPMVVRINLTTVPWLNVRDEPDVRARVVRRLLPLQTATVVDYRPRGSDVWGCIGAYEWICLQQYVRFYTSWRMVTPPPVPPRG